MPRLASPCHSRGGQSEEQAVKGGGEDVSQCESERERGKRQTLQQKATSIDSLIQFQAISSSGRRREVLWSGEEDRMRD